MVKRTPLLSLVAASVAGAAISIASSPRGPYSPVEDLDRLLFEGPNLFPHEFPDLIPRPDSAEEQRRYGEYLRTETERQQPVIDAAKAKRERKRLKRMGTKS